MVDYVEKCPCCAAFIVATAGEEMKCKLCGSVFALFDGKWRQVRVEIAIKGKSFDVTRELLDEIKNAAPGHFVRLPEDFPRPFSVGKMEALAKFQEAEAIGDALRETIATAGKKNDKAKPDWSLMPLAFVAPLIPIFEHGAREYGRDNWRKPFEDETNRFIAAIKRHLLEIDNGKPFSINALDSGVYHAAQIAWNALRLIWSVAGGGK